MRFKITLGGVSLGVTRLVDDSRILTPSYYNNRVYVCPTCGNAWARWEAEDERRQWFAIHRSCGEHPTGLWHGDRAGSLVAYPGDVLIASREMLEYETLGVTDIQMAERQYPQQVREPDEQ